MNLLRIKLALTMIAPLLAPLVSLHAVEVPKPFRAGAAASNITPPLGAGIVGSGTSAPASVHIDDELWARCLVLDNDVTRLAIVVCDNLHATRPVHDLAKEFIAKETSLPADHVLISATHTHSGPSAMGEYAFKWGAPLDDYQKFMARRIADGVRRALNNLEPARIGWGAGSVPRHVFNRRWHMQPDMLLLNPVGGADRVLMNPGIHNPKLLEQGSFVRGRKRHAGRGLRQATTFAKRAIRRLPSPAPHHCHFAWPLERMGDGLQDRAL